MVTAELRKEFDPNSSRRAVHRIRQRRLTSSVRSSYRSVPLLIGILLLILVGNTVLQAFVAKAQYRLNRQEQKISEIDKEINRMYIELADLGSERRIESIAAQRLGMHHAQPNEIAFLPGHAEQVDGGTQAETSVTEMLIASNRPAQRVGLSERFVEWLHGFGRTMADAETMDF